MGTPTTVSQVARLGNDVLENLLFAHGSLWVSDGTVSKVRRFDVVEGAVVEGAGSGPIPSPGGLAVGPLDGLIYAGFGNGAVNGITRSGTAKVVRFSEQTPTSMQDYAAGFSMANGMQFESDGDLYISNDFDKGLVRIPHGNPSGWHVFADVWGTNGLVIDPLEDNLYAAITFDQRSPIERIPLDAPVTHTTETRLSLGLLSLEPNVYANPDPDAPLLGVKGLDDMTRDGDGVLYPVGNGTGELLRYDPATKEACLITGALQNPSSVRIAPEGGEFSDVNSETIDFYVTEFSGRIMKVTFDPA